MRRKLIITLNILFIVGAFYLLVEDYKRVGKFQWVDPNMVDDNEELFLNPICVATIILGVVSIFNQLIPRFHALVRVSRTNSLKALPANLLKKKNPSHSFHNTGPAKVRVSRTSVSKVVPVRETRTGAEEKIFIETNVIANCYYPIHSGRT